MPRFIYHLLNDSEWARFDLVVCMVLGQSLTFVYAVGFSLIECPERACDKFREQEA